MHARQVPLAPDVDLGRIAATTPGMVGADLANLVNEAALLAARRNHEQVDESDFTDALERIVLGAERQIMMTPEDRRRTAYHEGGHAIVGMLTPGADPVRKVSIIPRGASLGVTFSAPESDRFNYDRRELQAKIKVALGGRAAEEVVFGEPTTGAESDIQQLTEIARQMVGRWGMSPAIGPIAVIPSDGGPLPGRRRGLGAHAAADRRRDPPDRRGGARAGRRAAPRRTAAARLARRGAARARDARRGRRLRSRRGRPRRRKRRRRGRRVSTTAIFSEDDRSAAFPELTDEQLAVLSRFGEEREYAAGDIVFRQGERYDFAVILAGKVAVVENLGAENERVVVEHGPRRFLGEYSLIAGGTRRSPPSPASRVASG